MPQLTTENEDGCLPDWQPVRAPLGVVLEGQAVRLAPLDAKLHADALYLAASGDAADARQWDYLAVGPFGNQDDFAAWLSACEKTTDPLFFTVTDRQTGEAQGVLSYLAIAPEHGSIEIGHIWFSAAMQQTRKATETIYLLARHAFDDLGYRRLEWKCDTRNLRSQRAALRFGFTPEGIFRQHRVSKGHNRDTAWFSLLDHAWPLQRAVFELWLSPANFDDAMRQRQSLNDIRVNLLSGAEAV
ncbi:GNAT family N-acetyltransferase [Glaciimonas sp. GG7]